MLSVSYWVFLTFYFHSNDIASAAINKKVIQMHIEIQHITLPSSSQWHSILRNCQNG